MNKPAIPDVFERFFNYYQAHNGSWGMTLHVVLEDGNTRDTFVDIETEAEARLRGDEEGAQLIAILRAMSRTQRIRISRLVSEKIFA